MSPGAEPDPVPANARRGTRTAPHIGKRGFVIYDFFGNHEYFNDSEAEVFVSAGGGRTPSGEPTPPKPPRDLVELGLEDEWLQAVSYVEVGPEGERVDKRDYVKNWERTIRSAGSNDPALQKIRSGQALTAEEEEALAARLNNPKYYFNEDNLWRAYRQPGGNLVDFIRHALGIVRIKSHEEEVTENFQAWLVSKSLTPQQAQYLSLLKNRGIGGGKLELDDLFKPPLSVLNAAGLGVELFGEQGLKEVISDLNACVFTRKSAQEAPAMKIRANFVKDGQWWVAWTEDVPGALTQGKTLEEARENLADAVHLMQEPMDLSKLPKRQVVVEEIEI